MTAFRNVSRLPFQINEMFLFQWMRQFEMTQGKSMFLKNRLHQKPLLTSEGHYSFALVHNTSPSLFSYTPCHIPQVTPLSHLSDPPTSNASSHQSCYHPIILRYILSCTGTSNPNHPITTIGARTHRKIYFWFYRN